MTRISSQTLGDRRRLRLSPFFPSFAFLSLRIGRIRNIEMGLDLPREILLQKPPRSTNPPAVPHTVTWQKLMVQPTTRGRNTYVNVASDRMCTHITSFTTRKLHFVSSVTKLHAVHEFGDR